jgi:lambda family phage portal protein
MNDNVFLTVSPTAYEGASHGRRMAGWRPSTAGPNRTVDGSLETLRSRSRDLTRNSAIGAAVLRCWTASLVGYGITPRPATAEKALKTKLVDLWSAWATVADADGGSLEGQQQLAVRAWLEAGEVFVRFRPRRIEDGLPVPLQVQLLEADMLPLFDADNYPGLPAGNRIRQGIELNGIGKRVAYWFHASHPGDTSMGDPAPDLLTRVSVEYVAHLYEPTRPGQLRGVPIMAPAIAKMRALDDFEDATLERQRLANLFTLFVTKPVPSGSNDPLTGMPAEGTLDAPLAGLEPGTSQELLPGEDVRFSEPPGAGVEYDAYVRRQMLALSAAVGVPYELVSGDVVDVSDRSLRLSITEFRRACEAKIYGVLQPRLLDPIRRAWAMAAFIGGQLTKDEAGAALAVVWTPPAWAALHPTQDIDAAKIAVDAGFRSRSDVISTLGFDPDQVDAERAADKKRADDLGISTTSKVKVGRRLPDGSIEVKEVDAPDDDGETPPTPRKR